MPDVQREKSADRIVFLCGREQREHHPKLAHIVPGVLRGQIREGVMSTLLALSILLCGAAALLALLGLLYGLLVAADTKDVADGNEEYL